MSWLHGARRVRGADLSSVPWIELAQVSAAAGIIHLDRVVQTVALDNTPVGCFPSAAPTAARPRCLRSDLVRVRKAGKRIAPRKRPPDPPRSGRGHRRFPRMIPA